MSAEIQHDDDPKRPPPAYQEYPADLLAMELLRTMSLAERGLLATMRWAAWVNDDLPADHRQLGRVLGVDLRTLRANLTTKVRAFFAAKEGDESRLVCPELADQKRRLIARRERLSAAGKEGGRLSAQARASLKASPQASPQASLKPPEKRRAEPIEGKVVDPWVEEYERAEKIPLGRRA